MVKFQRIFSLLIIVLLLTGCGKNNKYKVNDELELSGTISSNKIVEEGESKTVNVLNLKNPITIGDKTIKKIEISSDKELKDDANVSIKGHIEEAKDNSKLDFSYVLYLESVDDASTYVNTFSNDKFSTTIPSDLIPITTIEKIDNGFIIYSTNNLSNGGEVFRIYSVPNSEFDKLTKNENNLIEKIASNNEETIIIKYPTTKEYDDKYENEYTNIGNAIPQIKKNTKMF